MNVQNNLPSRVAIRSSRVTQSRVNTLVFFSIKQLFDVLVSFFLLLLFSPLFIIITILLYKNEGSPILSREMKTGKNGRPFTLYRFRTLTNRSKVIRRLPPHPFGVPNSFFYEGAGYSIITRTGRLLLRFKLDRLPELFNIFLGQMSFIGPEPKKVDSAAYYNNKQQKRLTIKPGIISYHDHKKVVGQGYEEKVNADLYYINNCSYFLEIKIAARALLRLCKLIDIRAWR